MTKPVLPIIDLSPIRNGGTPKDWEALGKKFAAACRDTGFAYLVNHGVPQEKVDQWFEMSKSFFDLDFKTKQTAKRPDDLAAFRGYIAPGKDEAATLLKYTYTDEEIEKLGPQGYDRKESYSVGSGVLDQWPNFWPSEEALPGFRETCEGSMRTISRLQEDIFKILAHGIPNFPLEVFHNMHTESNNELSLAHYFSLPWEEVEKRKSGWLCPHTDFTTFTFVFQKDVSGLEVEDQDHRTQFLPVAPIPGAIVFNVGDFLERLTNDQFKSTVHRVAPVKPSNGFMTEDRYSIAYFCSPNVDTVIEPLPGTWNATHPKIHKPVKVEDWFNEKAMKATNVA